MSDFKLNLLYHDTPITRGMQMMAPSFISHEDLLDVLLEIMFIDKKLYLEYVYMFVFNCNNLQNS